MDIFGHRSNCGRELEKMEKDLDEEVIHMLTSWMILIRCLMFAIMIFRRM